MRRLPLVGGFLTEDRVADLRRHAVQGVLRHRGELTAALERGVDEGVDVHALVERKVASFPVETVEELVLKVAAKELRAIEVLGGVLGGVVGLAQAGILAVL